MTKTQTIIIILISILILIAGILIGVFFTGKMTGNSKIKGNFAKIVLNVNWLSNPIVIIVEDKNGLKIERRKDHRFGVTRVGKFENVDFSVLDWHFAYVYKNRKIVIIKDTATLDGKKVDIRKPIKIIIEKKSLTPTSKTD